MSVGSFRSCRTRVSRGSTAEAEQHKDVWDMGVFGHGRKRLDFTVIVQPWLRDAVKHWVLEELPLRQGTQRRRCAA